ncbi:LacI family DNA-binding transcriptional regulator [Pseudonocardia acaciae]|uniref:LacI family DNA-binding transcriptional regulator n=1 Tax=Pseudonocardia acaciae TaxID=551276 RepID=UPI0007E8D2C3|nr:LacI family DNA-binding transcriptional regulator [Pseudonocardia acaciae]
MGYAEKRGNYWRARYKIERGRYGTVVDSAGETVRFRTRRKAEKAANDAEARIREGRWRDTSGKILFGDYVSRWYAAQDLAASTLQNYRRHIEEHLLPTFESYAVDEITRTDIGEWEKRERALGYAESSIKSWRAVMHLIMADAVDEELRDANPAARRRGRGRRSDRLNHRGPEKVVTTALGILLIAERAALLSGRDDEFVAIVVKAYTGMRWGELVGLETQYARPASLRVEWQLYELDTGELLRCPPKEGSRRLIDLPTWLAGMLLGHIARTQPKPCSCHGLRYAFGGHRPAPGAHQRPGPKLVDVARRAGVSIGTASAVLNRPETVSGTTRSAVNVAITELGYMRGGPVAELAPHWRRSSFATWLFQPAATGWYPKKGPRGGHPVSILAEPWPGVPVRGRGAAARATACWLPIAAGLTPHGLRHTHKTLMDGLNTPPKLMDERMGHEDGSVQARYSHITADMRRLLMAGLTDLWEAGLEQRRALNPGSPVAVLDALLKG